MFKLNGEVLIKHVPKREIDVTFFRSVLTTAATAEKGVLRERADYITQCIFGCKMHIFRKKKVFEPDHYIWLLNGEGCVNRSRRI